MNKDLFNSSVYTSIQDESKYPYKYQNILEAWWDYEHTKIYIDCRTIKHSDGLQFDTKTYVRFTYDPGASTSCLNFDNLEEFGLTEDNIDFDNPISGVGYNGTSIRLYPVIIPVILIGEFAIKNFKVYTNEDYQISNLLGLDIHRYFKIEVVSSVYPTDISDFFRNGVLDIEELQKYILSPLEFHMGLLPEYKYLFEQVKSTPSNKELQIYSLTTDSNNQSVNAISF